LGQDFLSDIELYFSDYVDNEKRLIHISGDEAKHIVRVMRHSTGDTIYITDGKGIIFQTIVKGISADSINCQIESTFNYINELKNISICIPLFKNFDRLEFALEKSVELGVTNFVLYKPERSIKKNPKIDRWQKICLSAMKQSLRSFVPNIKQIESLQQLKGEKVILLDQNSSVAAPGWLDKNRKNLTDEKHYFLFGPEGGFGENELSIFRDSLKIRLTKNRLRSETAIITFASLLNINVE